MLKADTLVAAVASLFDKEGVVYEDLAFHPSHIPVIGRQLLLGELSFMLPIYMSYEKHPKYNTPENQARITPIVLIALSRSSFVE